MLSILLRVTSDVALHQATSLCKFELAALQVSHDEIFFWVLSEKWVEVKYNTEKCFETTLYLPEFVYLHTVVWHMGQVKALEPFRVSVIIVSFYTGGGLLEADVVEACEAGTIDILDGVVRYQEVLLPPHEHKVRLLEFFVIEAVRVEVLGVLVEC